jgi:hypothetical protein
MRVIVALLSAIMLTFSTVAQAEYGAYTFTLEDTAGSGALLRCLSSVPSRCKASSDVSACSIRTIFLRGPPVTARTHLRWKIRPGPALFSTWPCLGFAAGKPSCILKSGTGTEFWFKRKFKSPAVSECRAAWTAGSSPPVINHPFKRSLKPLPGWGNSKANAIRFNFRKQGP